MSARDRDGLPSGAAGPLAFVGFLTVGCAYVVGAKLIGVPAAWVTFVPVALMVLYGGSLLLVGNLRLRDDQAGDNIYYLGFIYTLASLGVSLYQFGEADSAEAIVRNFGIAVASTITGVAGRVLFAQMRRDPVEIERVARLELAEAARRVRRELDGTVVEMAYFRRQVLQMTEEGLHETRERLGTALTDMQADMERSMTETAAALGAAQVRLAAGLDAVAEVLGAHAASLERQGRADSREASEDVRAATENLASASGALALVAGRREAATRPRGPSPSIMTGAPSQDRNGVAP